MKTDKQEKAAVSTQHLRSFLSLRQMLFFTLYGAIIFVFKLALASLPNIEPVSLLLFLAGRNFHQKGLVSLFVYVSLEFLFFGINLWSVSYLYVWLVIFEAGYLLRSSDSALLMALACALFGLLFGALCALILIPFSSLSGAFSWWMAGIPFDLMHCAGNFVFCLLLFHPLNHLLEKLAAKLR